MIPGQGEFGWWHPGWGRENGKPFLQCGHGYREANTIIRHHANTRPSQPHYPQQHSTTTTKQQQLSHNNTTRYICQGRVRYYLTNESVNTLSFIFWIETMKTDKNICTVNKILWRPVFIIVQFVIVLWRELNCVKIPQSEANKSANRWVILRAKGRVVPPSVFN